MLGTHDFSLPLRVVLHFRPWGKRKRARGSCKVLSPSDKSRWKTAEGDRGRKPVKQYFNKLL